ncbi:MAG: hypothetical protein JWP27_3043 [Flaviaesturariibacter sp.]|nr:hypothetical protein [Flaviaesturariibacter sp.]
MKNEPLNNPFSWLLAALLAAVFIASCSAEGPSDTEAAQDMADYSAAVADGGVSLCAEFNRVPVWTKSGDLVCRVPAARASLVAQGGAL